jgi:type II secretory pathway predicted ATPase ExeA
MARAPYPGLRPFARDDADIFFGRESHVDAMVNRLARQRILMVTGSSGSGKSSGPRRVA